jgi:membrane fusion protein, multidrug efflux system
MKSKYIFPSLLLAVLGLMAGCNPSEPKAPPTQLPVVQVKLTQPKHGDITRFVSLPGNVIPNQQAALYAKVTGYLKAIHVDKGDSVKEGDLLAEIEVPELLADLARTKAEVEVANVDYKRILEAQQKAPSLVVAQSIDTARAKSLVAKANLERAETLLQFCKITAPFSGTITKRFVDPGAFIPAATSGNAAQSSPLLTIADFSVVRVQVAVPEPETPFICKDLPVKISIDELPGANLTGSVTRFSHSLDDATKTMLAEIDLPNSDHKLLPGMYANVKIGVETHTNALLIPVDALVTEKMGTSVFKVSGGKAQKVPVKTGFSDGSNVEVLEGVAPEESLILVGKQTLSSGQPVTVTEGK